MKLEFKKPARRTDTVTHASYSELDAQVAAARGWAKSSKGWKTKDGDYYDSLNFTSDLNRWPAIEDSMTTEEWEVYHTQLVHLLKDSMTRYDFPSVHRRMITASPKIRAKAYLLMRSKVSLPDAAKIRAEFKKNMAAIEKAN